MAARPDVVVLGAGVSGLSTGIRLVESGARVLVRTAAPPAHTTSALAGAMVGPNLSPPGDIGLHPVRGPRIVVRNPGLDRFFMEAPMAPTWASIFPHGDHVVLGGGQRRSDDTTPIRPRRPTSSPGASRSNPPWPPPRSSTTASGCVPAGRCRAWRPSGVVTRSSCTTTATRATA